MDEMPQQPRSSSLLQVPQMVVCRAGEDVIEYLQRLCADPIPMGGVRLDANMGKSKNKLHQGSNNNNNQYAHWFQIVTSTLTDSLLTELGTFFMYLCIKTLTIWPNEKKKSKTSIDACCSFHSILNRMHSTLLRSRDFAERGPCISRSTSKLALSSHSTHRDSTLQLF